MRKGQRWIRQGWRVGFAIGVFPALLTLWIRWKMREPDSWTAARDRARQDETQATGRLRELFSAAHLRSTIIGVTLATIGLVTFWGGHIYGKNALMRKAQSEVLLAEGIAMDADQKVKAVAFEKHKAQIKRAEMSSMTLNTIGAGIGLVFFGGISNRLGRKGAFVLYHTMAFVMMMVL